MYVKRVEQAKVYSGCNDNAIIKPNCIGGGGVLFTPYDAKF